MKSSYSSIHTVRGIRYHVRTWGDPTAAPLVLLHGWMDVSASFQFLVDDLKHEWHVAAPDWRGFGLSEWNRGTYWFPDYLGDLDKFLEIYFPETRVNLVGHSLGGNVACLYAGLRPHRVRGVVSLEGFGIMETPAEEAPERYIRWLNQLHNPPRLRSYPSFDAVAKRLQENNPRLLPDRAAFLARHWARQIAYGEIALTADPAHRMVNPVLYRIEEAIACWKRVTAPVLWVRASESATEQWIRQHPDDYAKRKEAFAHLTEYTLPGAGHMMHHDSPRELATLIEQFLNDHP